MLNIFFARNRRNFQRFSDDTSIHGFKELFYAKSFVWLTLWTILIGAAIGVTAYQIYGSVRQYLDQTPITLIQPAIQDQMVYPSLKICYPHWLYWVDWQKGYNQGFTKEGMLYGLSYLTTIYSTRNFNISDAQTNFIERINSNNISTIRQFYHSISIPATTMLTLTNNESYIATDFLVDRNNVKLCHIVSGDNIVSILKENNAQIKKVRKTSKTNFISMFVLTKATLNGSIEVNGAEYARYVADFLSMEGQFNSSSQDYSAVNLPTFVYPNIYDTSGAIAVSYQFDKVSISIKTSIHKWKSSQQTPCQADWKWITMNASCTEECLISYYSSYMQAVNLSNSLSDAILFNSDTTTSTISMNPIKFFLQEDASVTTLQQTTSSASELQSTMYYQSSQKEGSTTAIIREAPSDESQPNMWDLIYETYTNCTNNCEGLTGCMVYTFDVNVQTSSLYRSMGITNGNNRTFVMIEYPTENEVLVMTEQDSKTWEDFIGNVGGLLGIWTGASILSFVQLVYLCCCADCDNLPILKIPERVFPKKSQIKPTVNQTVIHVEDIPKRTILYQK